MDYPYTPVELDANLFDQAYGQEEPKMRDAQAGFAQLVNRCPSRSTRNSLRPDPAVASMQNFKALQMFAQRMGVMNTDGIVIHQPTNHHIPPLALTDAAHHRSQPSDASSSQARGAQYVLATCAQISRAIIGTAQFRSC